MVFSEAMRALEIDAEKYVAKSRKYIRMNTQPFNFPVSIFE